MEKQNQLSYSGNPKDHMSNDDSASGELATLLFSIAQSRCKQSYERLFVLIAPRLLNFARKQLGDESMALEMVQETMLKLWLKANLYDESKGAAVTWIYSIARNVKFDLLRRSKHQQDWIQGDDLWPVLAEEVDSARLPKELESIVKQELHELVDSLPPAQAEVVRFVWLQGISHQEVADTLGVPLGTVKSRLRLALQKMKEVLDV